MILMITQNLQLQEQNILLGRTVAEVLSNFSYDIDIILLFFYMSRLLLVCSIKSYFEIENVIEIDKDINNFVPLRPYTREKTFLIYFSKYQNSVIWSNFKLYHWNTRLLTPYFKWWAMSYSYPLHSWIIISSHISLRTYS